MSSKGYSWKLSEETKQKMRKPKSESHKLAIKNSNNSGRIKKGMIPKNKGVRKYNYNCLYCNTINYSSDNRNKFCNHSCSSKYYTNNKTIGWNKGQRPSINTEFKKGHSFTDKEKKEISKRTKKLWTNEEYRKKVLGKRPKSSLEIKFESIIEKYNLPYSFVGNGEFSIANKIPDFINVNGDKIAIEVYCRKHKDIFRGGFIKWKQEREDLFLKYGWKTLFFDATEINDKYILEQLRGD